MAPGEQVVVAGVPLPGGMIYVGEHLVAENGNTEPALINPRLPVDHRRPDWAGVSMDYWPNYDSISPQARGAYLAWLAGGRKNPRAYIGYVFLFFYGLERRLLVDEAVSGAERDLLIAEIRRLFSIYKDNRSFRGYASQLLLALGVLSTRNRMIEAPPQVDGYVSEVPIDLRIGLGQFVAAGRPIPADWALAWHRAHPNGYPRTPALRCPDEFAEVFAHLYRTTFGNGMVIKPNKSRVTATYHPAVLE